MKYLAALMPGRSTALAMLATFVLGVSLNVGLKELRSPPTPPRGPADPAFASLGRAHAPRILAAEAIAYESAATDLEAGKPFSAAFASIPEVRAKARTDSFARYVAPDFAKLLPDGKADAEITTAERSAVVSAWRGFAKGLRGKSP